MQLKRIRGLPEGFIWLSKNREILKCGPVRKQRFARPGDKERIFYLCNDILIYCTSNNCFKGVFHCTRLAVRNLPDSMCQFVLISLTARSDEVRYTITADSPIEKQDWLQKFHTAYVVLVNIIF